MFSTLRPIFWHKAANLFDKWQRPKHRKTKLCRTYLLCGYEAPSLTQGLLDAQSELAHQTPAFRALRVPKESVTQPLQGSPWQGTVNSVNGEEVRLYSRTLTENGKIFAVIQVGQSLAQLHTVLHELVGELLVVGLLVLFACAVGSYWLAARAFAPTLAVTLKTVF